MMENPQSAVIRTARDLWLKGWAERNDVSPQDIAEGVAFLCSEAGRFVSGCELPYLFNS